MFYPETDVLQMGLCVQSIQYEDPKRNCRLIWINEK